MTYRNLFGPDWDISDAAKVAFIRSLDLPPCPACGGPSVVDALNITSFGATIPQFIQGHPMRCANQCWRDNPEGFIAAVMQTRTSVTPPKITFEPEYIDRGRPATKKRWWNR